MKPAHSFILALGISAAFLAGCSKPDAEKTTAPEKTEAPEQAGVTLDAETQERLGLKIETPAPAQWQAHWDAVGNVADPLSFAAAAADFQAARAAAAASQADFERTQTLAAQNNASPRALETAQAAAARDALAVKTAQAKFAGDWGEHLGSETNLAAVVAKLQNGDFSLVKLSLSVGVFPNPLPQHGMVFPFGNPTNAAAAADLADDLHVAPATQTQVLLYTVNEKLPPGISVTAQLQAGGEAVAGVVVPAGAIVRHQGAGWVYAQTATNRFERVEISLDKPVAGGWFVSENLSVSNNIVVTGAQSVLSAELSGAGFSTGQRD